MHLSNLNKFCYRIRLMLISVFVRQDGLGKGAVLTLMTVLLILAGMVDAAL